MKAKAILEYIKDNPRAIAKEIGCISAELAYLEKKEKVVRVGLRPTRGKRGRPSVEWALPGQKIPEPEPEPEFIPEPKVQEIPKIFLTTADHYEDNVLPNLGGEDVRIMRHIIKSLRELNRSDTDRRMMIDVARHRGYVPLGYSFEGSAA